MGAHYSIVANRKVVQLEFPLCATHLISKNLFKAVQNILLCSRCQQWIMHVNLLVTSWRLELRFVSNCVVTLASTSGCRAHSEV